MNLLDQQKAAMQRWKDRAALPPSRNLLDQQRAVALPVPHWNGRWHVTYVEGGEFRTGQCDTPNLFLAPGALSCWDAGPLNPKQPAAIDRQALVAEATKELDAEFPVLNVERFNYKRVVGEAIQSLSVVGLVGGCVLPAVLFPSPFFLFLGIGLLGLGMIGLLWSNTIT